MSSATKGPTPRVAYYYRDQIANYSYGQGHPMKPYRLRLANELILAYGLYKHLDCFDPVQLDVEHLTKFHAEDYVQFLKDVRPQHQQLLNQYDEEQEVVDEAGVMSLSSRVSSEEAAIAEQIRAKFRLHGVDGDCPIFPGLWDFCTMYAGGSVGGAWKLNRQTHDICINWAGGLHHAKKAEVSGFCYSNDIVLAILELLRYHQRVLYIDIDVHHGDGVEEAFYCTDRVMSVSFHRYGEGFFPCTGAVTDKGHGAGLNYALNFPLHDGIDDDNYQRIFRRVIGRVMERYRPGAIVLQCGADSLTGDKLGPFNLTLHGHGSCAEYCKTFGVPLLMLGGGGYTVRNVARAWAFETAVALGRHSELNDELPFNQYIRYWGPDYKLHLEPSPDRPNKNSQEYLASIETQLLQQLQEILPAGPPSVQYATLVARDEVVHGWRDEIGVAQREDASMDTSGVGGGEGSRQHAAEFFDNEKDQDASTMPTTSSSTSTASFEIVRPKPEVSIMSSASASASASASTSASTKLSNVHVQQPPSVPPPAAPSVKTESSADVQMATSS